MQPNSSSQLPKSPSIHPLPSVRNKIWRVASLTLTIGGLALMGWGVWLFIQDQIEANKPPPARILEINVTNVNDVLEPQPLPVSKKPPVQEPVDVTDELAPSLTTNPLPAIEEKVIQSKEETIPQSAMNVTVAETESETPDADPVVEAAVSLADNPLPVIEAAEITQSATESRVEIAEAPSFPQATSPPTRIVAESINLDAEVIEVGWEQVIQNGKATNVWVVADYAAGWHQNSALPGQGGNVVFSGHHNIKGEVFRYLVDLEPGDTITLYANDRPYTYTVTDKFIVKDKGEPEAVRQENAKWIGPFNEERLTLVTCWPYNNNTHRLIVIAHPVEA